MIEVDGLTKYYGSVAAIEDVSFQVERGEIIGFLGPNGAGKTTTMRILTGFSPPTRGKAVIEGFDIGRDPIEVKRRVGYLPESVPLYAEMIVRRFLAYVAEVKGVGRGERRREVDRVMERCGLSVMGDRVIRNLSKGYRQRVGLAQALVGSPPVLILDEPTVGLDPKQIVEIRQMIKELATDHTVLLSTHILPEVAMICQRVLIIHEGRIVAQDSMANLAGGGDPKLDVEVQGERARVVETLQAVAGVHTVVETGPGRYLVSTPGGEAIRMAVAKSLTDSGFGLSRLEERQRTLEDVFMESISADSGEKR